MKEKVLKQLDQISKDKEKTVAQLNALIGAERALLLLLEDDKKDESEAV